MFYDADHPDVSLSDWQTFVRECPSDLIAELIDWSEIGLPDWFVPLARGVGIASDALLRKAGHQYGTSRPRGWRQTHVDVYVRDIIPNGLQSLMVRQCDDKGLWTVERFRDSRPYEFSDELLVHQFGSTPIFTRSYQSAMRLAMHCHVNEPAAGLRWISACPTDYQDAADKRRIDEALRAGTRIKEIIYIEWRDRGPYREQVRGYCRDALHKRHQHS